MLLEEIEDAAGNKQRLPSIPREVNDGPWAESAIVQIVMNEQIWALFKVQEREMLGTSALKAEISENPETWGSEQEQIENVVHVFNLQQWHVVQQLVYFRSVHKEESSIFDKLR